MKIEDDNTPKTPDEEWAETLKINFEKPKTQTPPPLPDDNTMPGNGSNNENSEIHTTGYAYSNPPENSDPNPRNDNFQRERPDMESGRPDFIEPMPSTYLIWAILCTILCCFIPGIIAIVFSSQVSSRYFAGDIEGAKRSSRMAQIWIIVSFVLGILAATLWLPFMIFTS